MRATAVPNSLCQMFLIEQDLPPTQARQLLRNDQSQYSQLPSVLPACNLGEIRVVPQAALCPKCMFLCCSVKQGLKRALEHHIKTKQFVLHRRWFFAKPFFGNSSLNLCFSHVVCLFFSSASFICFLLYMRHE